jgi:hypothetical protein
LEVEGLGSSAVFELRTGADHDIVRATLKAGYAQRRRAVLDPARFPDATPYGSLTLGETCRWRHMEAVIPLLGTSEGPGSATIDKFTAFFQSQPHVTAVTRLSAPARVQISMSADPGWATGELIYIADCFSETGPQVPQMSHRTWNVERLSGTTYLLRIPGSLAYVDGAAWPVFTLQTNIAERCYAGRFFDHVRYGHKDAADIDSRPQHLDLIREACALAWFSPQFRRVRADLPETAVPAVFSVRNRQTNADETLTLTAAIPDAVKEWAWTLAHFLSLQNAHGGAHGGAEISRYQSQGGNAWALSPDSATFVYAPDAFASWQLAAAAGLLAWALPTLDPAGDHTAAVALLKARARRAWDWAEANLAAAPFDADIRVRRARYAAACAIHLSHQAAGDAATRDAAMAVIAATRTSWSRLTSWDGAVALWVAAHRQGLLPYPLVTYATQEGTILGWLRTEIDALGSAARFAGMLVGNTLGLGTGGMRRGFYDDTVNAPLAALRLSRLAMAFWSHPDMTAARKALLREVIDRENLFNEGANPYGAPLYPGMGARPMIDTVHRDGNAIGRNYAPFAPGFGPISSGGVAASGNTAQLALHDARGGWPARTSIPAPVFWSDTGNVPAMNETILHGPLMNAMILGGARHWLHAEAP